MIYIDGVGYIDQSSFNIATIAGLSPASTTKTNTDSFISFSDILKTETDKYNQSDYKEYKLSDIFKEAAEKYNISQDLLETIGYYESRFTPDAVSSAGAMGIMQLMPETAKAMGVNNAYDAYQNIMGAAKLLNYLSKLYDGDLSKMIAAYASGTGTVAKYDGVPPFKDVQNYVARTLDTMKQGVNLPDITILVNTKDNTSQVTSTNGVASLKEADESDETVRDSAYYSLNLDKAFSYENYELLMEYFTKMLEIIANMGKDDNEDIWDMSSDDSLTDLFLLGAKQNRII